AGGDVRPAIAVEVRDGSRRSRAQLGVATVREVPGAIAEQDRDPSGRVLVGDREILVAVTVEVGDAEVARGQIGPDVLGDPPTGGGLAQEDRDEPVRAGGD